MKQTHKWFLGLTIIGCAQICASGGNSIGVNFTRLNDQLAGTASAGAPGYAQTNWNNLVGSASGLLLKDNNGTTTSAALTFLAAGGSPYIFSGVTTGPEEVLNNVSVYGSGINTTTFSLINIPYSNYKLVIYDLGNTLNVVKGITVGSTTFYTKSPSPTSAGYADGNINTPYIYTLGNSTSAAAPTANSDYVVFSNLSGANQTVSISSAGIAGLSGFQIVEVPEPAVGLIFLAGLCRIAFRKN